MFRMTRRKRSCRFESGAERLLHVGQVLYRQESLFADQHFAVGDAIESAAVRRRADDGVFSMASGRSVTRTGVQSEGQRTTTRRISPGSFAGGKKGGKPTNLSIRSPTGGRRRSKNTDLAAYIVGLASQPIPNSRQSITTNHTPINYGQQCDARDG